MIKDVVIFIFLTVLLGMIALSHAEYHAEQTYFWMVGNE